MSKQICRLCGAELKQTLVDLGKTALANSYVKPEDAKRKDPAYALHARVCGDCFLVQIEDSVPPQDIFSDYAYFSSYSEGWVAHAKRYAEAAAKRLELNEDSLVVEVASNDGYLLQHFVGMGIPVLGVEPAANIAVHAEKKGVPTRVDFFGRDVARDIAEYTGKADLTAANNVLAHVPVINDFVAGFAEILKPEGVSTFEFPHLLNLMDYVQFDTIYHEHFSYLSLLAVENCLKRHGMRVFDVEQLPTHGGSLRIWACLNDASHQETAALTALRETEAERGLDKLETYEGFTARVEKVRADLLDFLTKAKASGKKIAAYGAAAKGNTLLNYSRI
ncbi:MAG: class I SAM-dependent methyltransferase, partial [Alphaproteobacteria bacterium]|nr:class I SAM-dependent methyltransferase [Alphaproteobacteria bacterium]